VMRNLSDRELHARYCPLKNTKSAMFIVAYFSVAAFVNWRGLHKAPEHYSLLQLPFAIIVAATLIKWLVSFTCFRDRLVSVFVIVILVTGEVEGLVPTWFGQHSEMVRSGHFALSLLGLVVSVTMLITSARSPKFEAGGEARTAVRHKGD
jgi:hypothetical protein